MRQVRNDQENSGKHEADSDLRETVYYEMKKYVSQVNASGRRR